MKVRLTTVALAVAALWLAPLAALAVAAQSAQPAGQTAASEKEASPSPAAGLTPSYVIQPGDVLDIQVWKEPEVSKTIPVRPDGKVSLPLVNDIQASGLTAGALTADLTQRLKKFISEPQVTVMVTEVNSQRFYVMGEVTRGGTYPLVPGMTVLQGLSGAGGFTPFANPKKIYVLRDEGGKQVKYPFNYKDVVKGKSQDQNIELRPGDTIVVP
ncbi:MAG TPA: polysaccharide biosynthesis/export family protein [Terriglobia bacterium]|nr:polysaccharide biosynthesis/export family protein [Terriglobia bacterium]